MGDRDDTPGTGEAMEPLSLVESACLRPRMYTLGGSFAELVCFLEGLFCGEPHSGTRSPRGEAWGRLAERLRLEMVDGTEGGGWQAGFIALRRRSSDDHAALDRLAALYKEVAAEAG